MGLSATSAYFQIANCSKKLQPGGLDKGGMWEFARSVAERVKNGGVAPLRVKLEAGNKVGGDKVGPKRRRRRR